MNSEILALLCPDWRGAMLVVDPHSMAVAYANIYALAMFRSRYPVQVTSGNLHVAVPNGSKRLRSTLEHLLSGGLSEASLVLDDPDRQYVCGFRIRLPQGLLRQALERHLHAPGRIAVLDIATATLPLSRADLRAMATAYQLTGAELVVLSHMVDGLSLNEIAALRQVSLETVRHHCKRLLSKTRCRRQSELVRLVFAICGRASDVVVE